MTFSFFSSSFEKIAQMISLHLKRVFKTFIAGVTVEVKNEAAHCGLLCKTGITISSSLSWIQGLEHLVVTFLAGLRCWLEVSLFMLEHNESHGDPQSASRLLSCRGDIKYVHMAKKWPYFLGGDCLISLSAGELLCCSQIPESLPPVKFIHSCTNMLYLF